MIVSSKAETPLGTVTLASDGDSLVGLWFDGQMYYGARYGELPRCDDLPLSCTVRDRLNAYFAGERSSSDGIPLAPQGTVFQKLVWELLCEIPYGETITYGALARETAKRMGREHMSAQAIGNAVGHNPISILIPCHRVIGANGNMTGYAGGIERKRALLKIEAN